MKKKFVLGILGIGIILAATLTIYLMKFQKEKASPDETKASLSKIMDIDEVARYPDRFKGSIGVNGKVIKVDETEDIFVLGCEDGCVNIPVVYKGQMPIQGSKIIVYGKVRQAKEGKYIIEGEEIKAK